LVLAAAAVLAGARSITAIAEWATDAPQPVRAALGTRRDPRTGRWVWAVPTETTIRRTLGRVDPEALAAAIGAWLADRDQPDQRRRAVAVDGKTLRGARRAADGRQAHLLAAMDHTTRVVLAQRHVDGAPGEVPAFQPLLADLDLAGAVVTADALHTHPDAAEFLVTGKQAHYLFCVKANQPTPLARCARLPWHHVPVLDRTRDHGHGRIELRTLEVVTVHHFGFPHAAQVLQVTRKTATCVTATFGGDGPWSSMRSPASPSPGQPGPACRPPPRTLGDRAWPALCAGCDLRRGRLPGPDRHRPQVMACLHNLIIGVLCRAGPVNLAAALRRHTRDPRRPLATLGISLG
jgi:DDE_Tnp_1-associated/Transposase DDE domain